MGFPNDSRKSLEGEGLARGLEGGDFDAKHQQQVGANSFWTNVYGAQLGVGNGFYHFSYNTKRSKFLMIFAHDFQQPPPALYAQVHMPREMRVVSSQQMRVMALRHIHRGVPENLAEDVDVTAPLEIPSRKGVSQHMRGDLFHLGPLRG